MKRPSIPIYDPELKKWYYNGQTYTDFFECDYFYQEDFERYMDVKRNEQGMENTGSDAGD